MTDTGYSDALQLVTVVLAAFSGEPFDSLTPATRLFHDLGIYGDDVSELLQELEKHRTIDWTGFESKRFFPDEPTLLTLLRPFVRLIRGKRSFSPLTIGHLAAVAARRKWFNPE